jgi:hypothetical protein
MDFVPTFVLSVFAAVAESGRNPARMLLVVKRPYAYLEDRLRRAFEGRQEVEIIADRRRGERRMADRRVAVERRQADRRTPKEEMLEVVIQGNPLTLFP